MQTTGENSFSLDIKQKTHLQIKQKKILKSIIKKSKGTLFPLNFIKYAMYLCSELIFGAM